MDSETADLARAPVIERIRQLRDQIRTETGSGATTVLFTEAYPHDAGLQILSADGAGGVHGPSSAAAVQPSTPAAAPAAAATSPVLGDTSTSPSKRSRTPQLIGGSPFSESRWNRDAAFEDLSTVSGRRPASAASERSPPEATRANGDSGGAAWDDDGDDASKTVVEKKVEIAALCKIAFGRETLEVAFALWDLASSYLDLGAAFAVQAMSHLQAANAIFLKFAAGSFSYSRPRGGFLDPGSIRIRYCLASLQLSMGVASMLLGNNMSAFHHLRDAIQDIVLVGTALSEGPALSSAASTKPFSSLESNRHLDAKGPTQDVHQEGAVAAAPDAATLPSSSVVSPAEPAVSPPPSRTPVAALDVPEIGLPWPSEITARHVDDLSYALYFAAGKILLNSGLFQRGLSFYQHAWEIRDRLHPGNEPQADLVPLYRDMSSCYLGMRQSHEAVQMLEQAARHLQCPDPQGLHLDQDPSSVPDGVGDDSAAHVAELTNSACELERDMAAIHVLLQEPEQAILHLRRAGEYCQRLLPWFQKQLSAPDLAMPMATKQMYEHHCRVDCELQKNLFILLEDSGRIDEAILACRRYLDSIIALLGDQCLEAGLGLLSLAKLLQRHRKMVDMKLVAAQSYNILKTLVGPDHPDTKFALSLSQTLPTVSPGSSSGASVANGRMRTPAPAGSAARAGSAGETSAGVRWQQQQQQQQHAEEKGQDDAAADTDQTTSPSARSSSAPSSSNVVVPKLDLWEDIEGLHDRQPLQKSRSPPRQRPAMSTVPLRPILRSPASRPR